MSDLLRGHSVTLLGGVASACCLDLNKYGTLSATTSGDLLSFRGLGEMASQIYYWASSANPCPGMTSFAIAANNGAVILKESQARWTTQTNQRYHGAPRVKAVDWLSTNVVIKGCKDGGVRLWDSRSDGNSQGSRIRHPSEINHVRRIDENTIIVAGLENQVIVFFASGFQIR